MFIVFYRSAGGDPQIQVRFRDESFSMPQKAIEEFVGVKTPAISEHLAKFLQFS